MKAPRNIKLVLGFDGTAYHGWQEQRGQPTIQGELREAIRRITGERADLAGSGRTDAGTHARAFVASFRTGSRMAPASFVRALNSVLPHDIRIFSAREVPGAFHARISARAKIYRYQVFRGKVLPPHLAREHFHFAYPLDTGLMTAAAGMFAGTHDFAGFAASGSAARDTVRHIFGCSLKSTRTRMVFTVEGSGFLHHMVRNMVGTLLELGRGQMTLKDFELLFEHGDRTLAGFTAPARGLILIRVRY